MTTPSQIAATIITNPKGKLFSGVVFIKPSDNQIHWMMHSNDEYSSATPPTTVPPYKMQGNILLGNSAITASKISLINYWDGSGQTDPSRSNQIRLYYLTVPKTSETSIHLNEICLSADSDGSFIGQKWFAGALNKEITTAIHKDSPLDAKVVNNRIRVWYQKANDDALTVAYTGSPQAAGKTWDSREVYRSFPV